MCDEWNTDGDQDFEENDDWNGEYPTDSNADDLGMSFDQYHGDINSSEVPF